MAPKSVVRTVAIVLCVGILAMTVPGAGSAEKRVTKSGLLQLISHPTLMLSSFLPSFVPSLQDGSSKIVKTMPSNSGLAKRPTGDIPTPRPGTGD